MLQSSDHIVAKYDDDLQALSAEVLEMGSLVHDMVVDAVQALKKRDSNMARSVIKRDQRVNEYQEEIDESAMRIIALRHPMALDLRRVIGAIRIANDLERIGDLAEGIARRAISINELSKVSTTKSIARMGKAAGRHLSSALDAFKAEDADEAMEIWYSDEDIDDSYNALFRELVTVMMESATTISACADLLFVAKNLERVGDHTSNICEHLYFMVHARPLIKDPNFKSTRDEGST